MPKKPAVLKAEAAERAAARSKRSPKEQLKLVRTRPGRSKKEVAKLKAEMVA